MHRPRRVLLARVAVGCLARGGVSAKLAARFIMPTSERSAGVVVFRRDPAGRAYLLLDYGKYWDFPKGHIEAGEDDRAAAVRELHEETGLSPDSVQLIDGFAREIQYFFRARGMLVRKEVILFLAMTTATEVTVSHEHVAGEFIPYEQALKRLKFANARDVLKQAEQFLAREATG
jgi:8-oxo-dGTP pyrophosphatase MutT (NUDIX family)